MWIRQKLSQQSGRVWIRERVDMSVEKTMYIYIQLTWINDNINEFTTYGR